VATFTPKKKQDHTAKEEILFHFYKKPHIESIESVLQLEKIRNRCSRAKVTFDKVVRILFISEKYSSTVDSDKTQRYSFMHALDVNRSKKISSNRNARRQGVTSKNCCNLLIFTQTTNYRSQTIKLLFLSIFHSFLFLNLNTTV
jgi:hypothetical protein